MIDIRKQFAKIERIRMKRIMNKSFGQILTEEMDKAEIGVNRLAELTSISKSYLSELKNDKKPPPSIPVILWRGG